MKPPITTPDAQSDAAREVRDYMQTAKPFVHISPRNTCEHDFRGWRTFEDGNGGEQVCAKCGLGAMAHTLRLDF